MTAEGIRTSAPLLGEPLAVEFMNTIWADRDGVHDALGDSSGAAAWLDAVADRLDVRGAARSLDHSRKPARGRDHDALARNAGQLAELRDALRRLAAIETQDPRLAAASAVTDRDRAIDTVNRACALAPAWSRLSWPVAGEPNRIIHSAHSFGTFALAILAEHGVALFAGPERTQLRACLAPGCVLYFVRDHPRREWCSASCGNRSRVARHYQRHHARGSNAQS